MKELGFWLYSTNVGQYFMKFNDDKARLGDVKKLYDVTPIHMLGISYFFPSKAVSQLLFFFSIKTERKTLRENSFFECLVVFSDDEALNEDFGKKRVRAPSLNPKKVRSHDDVRKGPKLKGVKSVTLPVSWISSFFFSSLYIFVDQFGFCRKNSPYKFRQSNVMPVWETRTASGRCANSLCILLWTKSIR